MCTIMAVITAIITGRCIHSRLIGSPMNQIRPN
jgi:hypothetical protein